jgi:hypothetical protein
MTGFCNKASKETKRQGKDQSFFEITWLTDRRAAGRITNLAVVIIKEPSTTSAHASFRHGIPRHSYPEEGSTDPRGRAYRAAQ